MVEWVQTMRTGALWLTLCLLAASALRFVWVTAVAIPEDRRPARAPSVGAATPFQPVGAATDPVNVEEAPPADAHIRVMLSVSYAAGPARVLVNGQLMGQAAYVGDFV